MLYNANVYVYDSNDNVSFPFQEKKEKLHLSVYNFLGHSRRHQQLYWLIIRDIKAINKSPRRRRHFLSFIVLHNMRLTMHASSVN